MEMTKFVSKMKLYNIFILQIIKNYANNLQSPSKEKTPHFPNLRVNIHSSTD